MAQRVKNLLATWETPDYVGGMNSLTFMLIKTQVVVIHRGLAKLLPLAGILAVELEFQ